MFADVMTSPQNAEASPGTACVQLLHALSHLDPRYGGLSAVVPALVSQLCRRYGYAAELDAFCLPGEQYVPALDPAVSLRFVPTSRLQWIAHRALQAELDRSAARADLVHIHGLWAHSTSVTAQAARRHHKPYVLSAHGMLEPWALGQSRLKKRLYAAAIERPNLMRAACLHALTEAEAESYRRWNVDTPIAVIPNAVDVPQRRTPASFLARFPELAGRRLVLFLGRLHPKKGIGLLLETWASLQSRWPDAVLVLAGPSDGAGPDTAGPGTAGPGMAGPDMAGPDMAGPGTTRRIQAAHVLYTGLLDTELKWSALAAAECFVLPSHSEGLSVAALEAMGAGLPVILSRQCNLPEVSRAECGWEIELSPRALARALEECLGMTQQVRETVGARGAALVARTYSWAAVTAQMAELYTWLLGGALPTTFQLHTTSRTR